MNLQRTSTGSMVVPLLLGGILVALIVIIAVIMFGPDPARNSPTHAATVINSDPPAALNPGQRNDREDLSRRGVHLPPPSRAVDTTRVKQTYKPGRTYKSLLQISISGRGQYKNWGITSDSYTQYIGELEIRRTIESNDGHRLVLVETFPRARSLSAWTKLRGIHIDLPGWGQSLLDFGGPFIGLPPGWATVSTNFFNTAFKNKTVLGAMNQLRNDPTAKVFAFVDGLQGKKVRLTYVNGKGVTNLQALRGTLTENEQDFIYDTSVICDAYILPDVKSKQGDTWTIHGRDMLGLLDPSMHATLRGNLTARRGADGGTPQHPTAHILLDRGVLNLQDFGKSTQTAANWAPRGEMTYDFTNGIVTDANLTGDIQVETHTTDYIIFETRWSVVPKYQIVYHCEVVK